MALVVANFSRGPARWHAWTHACCECSRRSEHHPPDARRSPATPASKAPASGHAGKRCRAALVVRTCNPTPPLLRLRWPLRVRASDFRPIPQPVQRPDKEPLGFFEFAPDEGLDFELLAGVLQADRQEAGSVDVVCLPESAVGE